MIGRAMYVGVVYVLITYHVATTSLERSCKARSSWASRGTCCKKRYRCVASYGPRPARFFFAHLGGLCRVLGEPVVAF